MNFSLGKRDAGTTPLHLLPAATLTVTLVGWFISRKQFDISQIGHDQADFKTLSGLAIVEQVFASYSIGTIFLAVTCGLIGFLTLAHILDAFSEFLFESVGQNLIFGTSLDRLRGTCQVEELLKKNVNSVGNDIENKIRKIRKAAIIFLTIIVLSIIWSAVERTAIIYQKIPIWFLDSAFFFSYIYLGFWQVVLLSIGGRDLESIIKLKVSLICV